MFYRLMIISVVALSFAGCATTQQANAPINQIQNQVVDLEQRMEEQEKEIVDIKYEVKEISGKIDAQQTVEVETSSLTPTYKESAVSKDSDSDTFNLIKVAVSPSEIQKALQGAGVYEGKIDGKIGSRTKAAIMEFQKQHNLKADGVIGQKTWGVLKTYLTE